MLALGYNFWSEWELMEKVDFDGINKLIIVYPHVTELDIREDVWSAWIRWDYMLDRNYNRFLGAMERTGLDTIPGGQTGDMYFLINGWRLAVNLANVKVSGILYSRDYDTAYYTPELNAQYPAQVSAIVNTVTVTENVIVATVEEIAAATLGGDIAPYEDTETLAGSVTHLKHLQYRVYLDADNPELGDGSQHSPFNNQGTALDYAEAHNLKRLMIYSDMDIDRNLKNFVIDGVGTPKIDLQNGVDLKRSEFSHCELTGTYIDRITAQECMLSGPFYLNGYFETCALGGDFTVPDGGNAYMVKCTPLVVGFTKPIYDIGGVDGTGSLMLMGYKGGATIRNCTQPTDLVKIVLDGGIVEVEDTCTQDNVIIIIGNGTVINSSSSVVNTDHLINKEAIAEENWNGIDLAVP